MPVNKTKLSIRKELGGGAFGTVYEVDTPKQLVRDPTCAFKELKNPSAEEIANIRILVDERARMSAADRAVLDQLTTWPLDMVTSGRTDVGYLMRIVPQEFIEPSITQVTGTTAVTRSLDWLANPDHASRSGANGIVPADDLLTRFQFCAWIARVFHLLHRHDMVYGDLSLKNALYSVSPTPAVMLIDTDPVRIENRSPKFRQATSPGMKPPEASGPNATSVQDVRTDRFKLAILLYNILGASIRFDRHLTALQGRIDAQGMQMFAAALSSDPDQRPSADEWYRYFYSQYAAYIQPPTITSFTAEPRHGIVGQAITLRWQADGYRSLVLHTPSGERHDIGVSAPNSMQVSLQQSGQFRLVATNKHGVAEIPSETVHVFTPPKIDYIAVPELYHVSRMITGVNTDQLERLLTTESDSAWVNIMLEQLEPPPLPPLLADEGLHTPNLIGTVFGGDGLISIIDGAVADADNALRHSTSGAPMPRRASLRIAQQLSSASRSRRQ